MLGNWTVKRKLLAGFIGTALFAGALGVVASQQIGVMVRDINEILALNKDVKDVDDLRFLLLRQVQSEQEYLLSGDEKALETHARLRQDFDGILKTNLEEARKTENKAEVEGFGKVMRMQQEYTATFDEIVKLAKARKLDQAIRLALTKADKQLDDMLADLSAVSEADTALAAKDSEGARSSAAWSRTFMLVLGLVAMALAVALGFGIARMITSPLSLMVGIAGHLAEGRLDQKLDYRSGDELGSLAEAFRGMIAGFSTPVGEAAEVLGKVAARDLSARMQGEYKGDFSEIKTSVNSAVDQLGQALSEVKVSADQVAVTSQQLSSASEEIASGAQEQASSLEETSATLEELTATVKQNADNARQANQLAAGSRESAGKGGQVVASAVSAMGEINTSSKRIADIITTIDEIAFQTNLLALNAAVEAARAGEQGRGFAVVASEVRNLAQRSASAAKEIKGLIQDSVRKVENGSELVNQSGHTLDEIVGSVKRVTDIVAEIAAASQEQSAGIEQVAKAMAQMDQVTQANASQTEELSSSAEELTATAEQLQALVSQFTLKQPNEIRRTITPGKQPMLKSTNPAVKAPPATKKQADPSGGPKRPHGLAALASATSRTDPKDFEEF